MAEERKDPMNGNECSPEETPKKKTINILITKDSLKLDGSDKKVDIKKFETKKD